MVRYGPRSTKEKSRFNLKGSGLVGRDVEASTFYYSFNSITSSKNRK